MKSLKDVVLRLRALLLRRRMDAELDEELQFHIAMQARKNRRNNLDPAEAERQARLKFGSVVSAAEECREQRGISTLEILAKDVRFSLRLLRKSPGFTVVAILTLALTIGVNALVFGVMNGLILRPLNVPESESLYGIEHGHEHNMSVSYPDYLDLRERNRSFDDLAAFNIRGVGFDSGETSSRAWIVEASGNYFDLLRVKPHLGRFFHSSDERGPNSAPYIVLGHSYWRTHFQSDPGVVGRVVRVNKHPFTVIGVAPPEFHGVIVFFAPDFYMPLVNHDLIDGSNVLDARGVSWVFMSLGHLKKGVTVEEAVADLNSIGAYLENTYPKDHGKTTFKLARPGLYGNYLGSPMRAFFGGLMMLAGLILLAACANLGGLFAARVADRSRDVALRLALGASRNRILRQMLTEAVLIALAGGAIGLWASVVLLRALSVWNPLPKYSAAVPVSPDGMVYGIALALAVGSGLLFGVVPVRQVLRADPYQIVKAGPGARIGRRITIRDILLVAQIAICAILVTSSMVAVRGLSRTLDINYGFEPQNALLADTVMSMAGYSGDQEAIMQKRMIDEVRSIPGVAAVGSVGRPPLSEGGLSATVFNDTTMDLRPSNAAVQAMRFNVSPEYFRAAGTALLLGRDFTWHDDKNSPRVAIVNQEFARRIFGSTTNAMGGYFKLRDGARLQVVGVAEDGKYLNLTEDPRPALFMPVLQAPMPETTLIVRSNRDLDQIAASVRATLRDLDRGLPVYIQTWNKQLDFALFPSRTATVALGVLGVMGAMLSLTGIFGMAAYSVSKRMRELGIRIALGAERRELLQAALGRAFKLLAFGSAAGLFLGILAGRVLASIVYQATPRDPLVLTGVVLTMLLLGLLATWIPARRALTIDPLILLREE